MQRVSVVGVSGSGKSTLGRALAGALAAPFTELDALFHQPGWTPRPVEEFRAQVSDVVAGDRWVVDGNYSAVRELVWARADTIVWLDRSRWRATSRVLARTLRRVGTRQELWNGNREHWTNLFRADPEQNIVLWSWVKHEEYAERYAAVMVDPALGHVERIRLRSDAQADLLVREVSDRSRSERSLSDRSLSDRPRSDGTRASGERAGRGR